MTTLEDQLRHALHDLADDVQPVHFLSRLDRVEARSHGKPSRRRMAVVAAAVVAAVATASVILLRLDRPSIIEPVQRPPKVFRLSGETTDTPGRALMALILARPKLAVRDGENEDPQYVLPAAGGDAVYLPGSDRVPYSSTGGLSVDGSRLIREAVSNASAVPRLEIVNLLTGATNELGGELGSCPQLSPDNGTVAVYSDASDQLQLVDVRSAAVRPGPRDPSAVPRSAAWVSGECTGLGWSPDGQSLAVPTGDGSFVADRRGRILHRLPDRRAVNSLMSWSPDGHRILLYLESKGRFVVRDLASGEEPVLEPPEDALRPIGWTGTRVVWLAGKPGDYQLLSTDQRGDDVRTWMRFDIGDRPITGISWSRDLSGTARD